MAASGLEEKYDAVKQLIAVGKERGYLLYDEVNDSLPAEVHSSEEIDDLLTTFERNGIEIYEDAASAKAARAVEVSVERGDRDGAVKDDGTRGRRRSQQRPGSDARLAGKNQRSRAHVFARNGHGATADARRRSHDCQAD